MPLRSTAFCASLTWMKSSGEGAHHLEPTQAPPSPPGFFVRRAFAYIVGEYKASPFKGGSYVKGVKPADLAIK